MSVKVTYHINVGWEDKPKQLMNVGLARMAADIHQMAVTNAPYANGALRNSGRFTKTRELSWTVSFGNHAVDYAVLRENVNHLHPNTTHYLQRAGQRAQAKVNSYFRETS